MPRKSNFMKLPAFLSAVALHLRCIGRKIGRKPIGFHLAGIAREFTHTRARRAHP